MTKRDEQRRQADRDFEEVRQAIAQQSTEWLCDALREIPHRKWIEIAKDERVAVGILAHRAADRIAELEHELDIRKAAVEAQFRLLESVKVLEKALRRCVAAIDATYADNSEAYGLPLELRESCAAAKSVL